MIHDTTQLALERSIEGAALRHSALAANLANAETPGYQRQEVDFHGTLSRALASGSATPEAVERSGFAAQTDASAAPVRADGSTVDADAESAKLAANALEHQAAVQIARTRIAILETAMGAR